MKEIGKVLVAFMLLVIIVTILFGPLVLSLAFASYWYLLIYLGYVVVVGTIEVYQFLYDDDDCYEPTKEDYIN